jgi:prevent-host-death family protein
VRTAGVREARQNLSVLLDEVKKGREVVITEHGRPVAKLVPLDRARGKRVPDFAALRRRMPVFDPPLSATLDEDREDRL